MDVQIRDATAEDAAFIAEMLLEAANWDATRPPLSLAEVLARPELGHYAEGWPRDGDVGVVAVVDGRPVGTAWLRFLRGDDTGYGWVADDVPELSIGVAREWRGRGIGGRLVDELVASARGHGIGRISLSVEPANRALELYRSRGFREVGANGGSLTMVLHLG